MSKNYKGIHYIQEQLKDFDKSFVNCVIRCFNLIEENKEPDGCLSNTTALYICTKSCGYNPIICYGLCNLDGRDFYHAWLEINDTIIDLSIYGNVNYSPYSMWDYKISLPYIGKYDDSKISYGKFKFDEDWNKSLISQVTGKPLIQYIDSAPQYGMWRLVCRYMNKTLTKELFWQLRSYAENVQL